MYDLPGTDTGREWVEVYNAGTDTVDLSTYKFTEATTNHSLRSINRTSVLAPGEYAVIADDSNKFIVDWPSYTGNLFDSTFSLSNIGATLTLKDSNNVNVDQVVYTSAQGANGDGNTLQRLNGGWVSGLASPGLINSGASQSIISTSTNNSTISSTTTSANEISPVVITNTIISTHYSYLPLSDFKIVTKYSISAGRDRMGVTGSPIEFKVESSNPDKNAIYNWTFGDGTKLEGKQVDHVYEFPGDYIVVVNEWNENEKSISRTKVKITEPKLEIVEANDKFISIKNNSKNEINLYGFEINVNENSFTFPQDTILASNSIALFSAKITRLSPQNREEIIIKNKFGPLEKPVVILTEDSPKIDVNYSISKKVTQITLPRKINKNNQNNSVGTESSKAIEKIISDNNNESANVISSIESASKNPQQQPATYRNWIVSLKHFFFGSSQ